MTTVTAIRPATTIAHMAMPKGSNRLSSMSPVLGLPQIGMNSGRVECSIPSKKAVASVATSRGTLLLAAVSVMSVSNPVLALVDERMSTEGTGLSLGISNNLLGWILLGIFGLIWSLYFVYTSTLEEDDDSGLSL